MDELSQKILAVENAKTESFVELVHIAGLDPAKNFRNMNLSGVDFSLQDLSGFDFRGTCLTKCNFQGARISKCALDINASVVDAIWNSADFASIVPKFLSSDTSLERKVAQHIEPVQQMQLAETGDNNAMFLAALFFEHGPKASQNFDEACVWYTRAGKAGSSLAMKKLSDMYSCGLGFEKDPDRGWFWLKRAAEAGDVASMMEMAETYWIGGSEQIQGRDLLEAKKWLDAAASEGNTLAMVWLGNIFREGLGFEPDHGLARLWYKKAIELGSDDARVYLGYLETENKQGRYAIYGSGLA